MNSFQFVLDGKTIPATPGQTILKAAEAAGIYIPHLCAYKDLIPHGSCRVCSVRVNGRIQDACVQTVTNGAVVESETEELREFRRNVIDMLFVEGNHYCMFCEKSGLCELQALAYRFGITAPKYPLLNPARDIDMSHPDVYLDHNRCILCTRCVRVCDEIEGAHTWDVMGRGTNARVITDMNQPWGTSDTCTSCGKCVHVCPTGALVEKGKSVPEMLKHREFLPYLTTMREAKR